LARAKPARLTNSASKPRLSSSPMLGLPSLSLQSARKRAQSLLSKSDCARPTSAQGVTRLASQAQCQLFVPDAGSLNRARGHLQNKWPNPWTGKAWLGLWSTENRRFGQGCGAIFQYQRRDPNCRWRPHDTNRPIVLWSRCKSWSDFARKVPQPRIMVW
jgi:hypothetical protein